MKTKRIATVALSAAMALSLAAPAFAAATPKPNTQTVINGKYEETVIDVTVPQTGTAALNPYGMGIELTKSTDAKVQVKGQIVSDAGLYITNNTTMDLDVGATITPALGSKATMKLSPTTTLGKDAVGTEGQDGYEPAIAPLTTKSAYVVVQAIPSTTAVATAELADTDIDKLYDEFATESGWASAEESPALTISSTGAKPVTVESFGKLAKSTHTSGEVSARPAGSIMLYRLTGDCVKTPKEAWTANDTFTVTIAFTFAPWEEPASPPSP